MGILRGDGCSRKTWLPWSLQRKKSGSSRSAVLTITEEDKTTRQRIDTHRHCETGSQTGRGNPFSYKDSEAKRLLTEVQEAFDRAAEEEHTCL